MKTLSQVFFQIRVGNVAASTLLLMSSGCIPSWHLQTVTVSGPLFEPAVHLQRSTEQPGFRIDPWLTVNTQRQRVGQIPGHTNVNAAGIYQVDSSVSGGKTYYYENPDNHYSFGGQNFTWRLPTISGGASFDLDVSTNVALFGGMGLSSVDNNPLWSAHAGLGYSFGTERISGRFDVGLMWETIATRAEFVRTSGGFLSSTEVEFFSSHDKRTRVGEYGALTLQSKGKDLAFFTQLAYGSQPIATLSRPATASGEDDEYVRSLKFVSLTPGLAWSLAQDTRLIVGVRFTSDTEISGTDSPFLVAPLAQLELSF